MHIGVVLLIILNLNYISGSIEIQDDGVFSEIQEIEVKKDNVFEEIILVRTTKKVKKEMQRRHDDNSKPKVNIDSDDHENESILVMVNPLTHIKELASGLSEASIGTMAVCFLFIALCCLSCTTGFSVKKLELNNLFNSPKLKLLLSPYVKQCFYMCFMDKINFPETLTREMNEIVTKNPHKYAHLALGIELDNPQDVCDFHEASRAAGAGGGSTITGRTAVCSKSSSSSKLKREILLDKRGDLRWANEMRASYTGFGCGDSDVGARVSVVQPKLNMVNQPLMQSFKISKAREEWKEAMEERRKSGAGSIC